MKLRDLGKERKEEAKSLEPLTSYAEAVNN